MRYKYIRKGEVYSVSDKVQKYKEVKTKIKKLYISMQITTNYLSNVSKYILFSYVYIHIN